MPKITVLWDGRQLSTTMDVDLVRAIGILAVAKTDLETKFLGIRPLNAVRGEGADPAIERIDKSPSILLRTTAQGRKIDK